MAAVTEGEEGEGGRRGEGGECEMKVALTGLLGVRGDERHCSQSPPYLAVTVGREI